MGRSVGNELVRIVQSRTAEAREERAGQGHQGAGAARLAQHWPLGDVEEEWRRKSDC